MSDKDNKDPNQDPKQNPKQAPKADAKPKAVTYKIHSPNRNYTGERWIAQPKLKKQIVFFKGVSQQELTKKEADIFIKQYPKYKAIKSD